MKCNRLLLCDILTIFPTYLALLLSGCFIIQLQAEKISYANIKKPKNSLLHTSQSFVQRHNSVLPTYKNIISKKNLQSQAALYSQITASSPSTMSDSSIMSKQVKRTAVKIDISPPPGNWRDYAKNVAVSLTPDGPMLHADMACKQGNSIHVDMLYVTSLEYNWVYYADGPDSPSCRFDWAHNQGIMKTWQIKELPKRKSWFNPVSNPQYMYQVATPLPFAEVLSHKHEMYQRLFMPNSQVIQVFAPQKVVALSLFAPESELDSWRAGFAEVKNKGKDSHRYLGPLFKNLDNLRNDSQGEYTVNIYLSDNLSFLEDKLISYRNVNIFYMGHSHAPNPGAMWRFLEISNSSADFIHVRDTDQVWTARDFSRREAAMLKSKKSFLMEFFRGDGWRDNRAAIWRDVIAAGEFSLRPRSLGIDNITHLMSGYIGLAESRRDSQNPYGFHDKDPINYWNHPTVYRGNTLGFGKTWPAYSFDQGFLKYVIYPYLVENKHLMMMNYIRDDNCQIVNGTKCAR